MIRYDELTFPEVDALPRDTPLRMPLGSNAMELPAVPYGYPGHPLEVPECMPLLESVTRFLEEDGFSDVRFVATDPPPWQPPNDQVALIPVGHTEQHGFHLPLNTDTVIAEALAKEAARRANAWKLPAWPYGVSMHRRQFPGTLSCDPRLFEDFFVGLVGRLREHGTRKVFFLNGHGGNHSFLVNVVKYAGDLWPDTFVATTFLHTASGPAAKQLHRTRTSQLMGHACELETSYMLHLRPDLVHLERAVDEVDFVSTPRYAMDWCSEGSMIANPPWTDDTRTGTYGAPTHATAEKGRTWFEAAAEEVAAHLREVDEQHRLRQQRRATGWCEGAWRRPR